MCKSILTDVMLLSSKLVDASSAWAITSNAVNV